MARAQRTRYHLVRQVPRCGAAGELGDGDSRAATAWAPHTRRYKSCSRPQAAAQHSWAFALSPARVKWHWQHGWQRACESPEERWSARAASPLPRAGSEGGGACIACNTHTDRHRHTDRHTDTELSLECYMVQHTERCFWNGLGSGCTLSSVDELRSPQPIDLPSIQPDKWQQKLPLSGFISPPYCTPGYIASMRWVIRFFWFTGSSLPRSAQKGLSA